MIDFVKENRRTPEQAANIIKLVAAHRNDIADMSNPDEFRRAIKPGATRLVWIETPSNPLLRKGPP